MRRNLLLCAIAALLFAPGASAQDRRIVLVPHVGALPFASVAAGVQLEVRPPGRTWALTADYSRWLWGLICAEDAGDGSERTCGEEGNSIHVGLRAHLGSSERFAQPYLGGGLGVRAPVQKSTPELSLQAEAGLDLWAAHSGGIRAGLRYQGSPQLGPDFLGLLLGLRLGL